MMTRVRLTLKTDIIYRVKIGETGSESLMIEKKQKQAQSEKQGACYRVVAHI